MQVCVSDFIDYLKMPYSMDDFIQRLEVKTNFLEYAKITLLIKEHLDWKDTDVSISKPQHKYTCVFLAHHVL